MRRWFGGSAVVALFLFLGLIVFLRINSGQKNNLPDYTDSKWVKQFSQLLPFMYKDRVAFLLTEIYTSGDVNSVDYSGVMVVHNEQGDPWFALYDFKVDETILKDGIAVNYQIFEYKDKKWLFVEDLSRSKDVDQSMTDFIKTRYDLVLE